MKNLLKTILYLLIAVPVIFTACQKSELTNDLTTNSVKSEQVIMPYVPCGNQMVANLYEYGNTGSSYGTLTVGNDATNLYITYQTSGGYLLRNTFLYVGAAEGLTTLTPFSSNIPSGGSGLFYIGSFPYIYAPGPPAPTYQKVIPLSSLPECFIIVAFADIPAGESYVRVSAKAPTAMKSMGYYLEYCKQQCKAPTCETAYAFGGDIATCFLTLPNLTSNNWGWTQKITGEIKSIHWPVYAGAGQCDLKKGTFVGYLDGSYVGGKLNLAYNLNWPFTLNVSHLYIGTTPLPVKNGKLVTAPGQFKNSAPIVNLPVTAPFYVAAHAEVCGPY